MSSRNANSPTPVAPRVLIGVLAVCALALALAPAAFASTPAQVQKLASQLSGKSGAYVFDTTGGQFIAAKSGGARRIIASNAKLFTSSAALDKFGTGGRFSTGIWTSGTLDAGILSGDIYLRGGGDPLFGSASFVTKNFGSQATVEKLAANLEAAGVTQVTGKILGDETVFDSRRGTAPYGFGASSEIGAQLSGLAYNKGFVKGKFQSNPPRYAAQQLRLALKHVGIKVGTRTGVAATPTSARRLAFVASLPMSALVRQMNKPSNNYLAEMLIKSLAMPDSAADDNGGVVKPGTLSATTAAGDAAAKSHAAGLGSRISLKDGSGLSRADRVAPREVVDLLRGMLNKTSTTDFLASLPIAGVDGTLAGRMKGSAAAKRCSAKTGTLSNVSALSGYCVTKSGHRVAFSILQNNVSPSAAHTQQDKLAAAIAGL
jgi:D-alanyl-D-alanine carboxypeptidase/D-alanyl-D-alanine-endopeptidase (penicillin-binding protein 4)